MTLLTDCLSGQHFPRSCVSKLLLYIAIKALLVTFAIFKKIFLTTHYYSVNMFLPQGYEINKSYLTIYVIVQNDIFVSFMYFLYFLYVC